MFSVEKNYLQKRWSTNFIESAVFLPISHPSVATEIHSRVGFPTFRRPENIYFQALTNTCSGLTNGFLFDHQPNPPGQCRRRGADTPETNMLLDFEYVILSKMIIFQAKGLLRL